MILNISVAKRLFHSTHPRLLRTMSVQAKQNLRHLIPPESWDSHMHVFPDADHPTLKGKKMPYVPPPATIPQAIDVLGPVAKGLKMCIVQPSVLGVDNSITLDGVKELDGKGYGGCGVVELDVEAISKMSEVESDRFMRDLHDQGSRGVRLNCVSRDLVPSTADLTKQFHSYADLIRPYGWVLQLYIPMRLLDELGSVLLNLGVPVCLDHFAHPKVSTSDTPAQTKCTPGFSTLLSLLSAPESNVYIKISGHYRLLPPSPTEQYLPLKEIFFSFLKSGGEQKLVWASDWPHTRFGSIDTIGWANMVVGWCEEYVKQEAKGDKREKDIEKEVERLVSLIFKENADTLWLGRQK